MNLRFDLGRYDAIVKICNPGEALAVALRNPDDDNTRLGLYIIDGYMRPISWTSKVNVYDIVTGDMWYANLHRRLDGRMGFQLREKINITTTTDQDDIDDVEKCVIWKMPGISFSDVMNGFAKVLDECGVDEIDFNDACVFLSEYYIEEGYDKPRKRECYFKLEALQEKLASKRYETLKELEKYVNARKDITND